MTQVNVACEGTTCDICSSLRDFTHLSWYQELYNPTTVTYSLLHSNATPLPEQTRSLRLGQSSAIQELTILDQKINIIQTLLDQRRSKLQQVVDDYQKVLSPVRNLPFEILRSIFLLMQSSASESAPMRGDGVGSGFQFRDPWMTIHNGPWYLGQVCQLWRAVALKTPQLWANIRILVPQALDVDGPLGHHPIIYSVLEEGIRRSASVGLHVRLCDDGYGENPSPVRQDIGFDGSGLGEESDYDETDIGSGDDETDSMDPIALDRFGDDFGLLHAILKHTTKIVDLEIHLGRPTELEALFDPVPPESPSWKARSYSSLERLSIAVRSIDGQATAWSFKMFKDLQALKQVRLHCWRTCLNESHVVGSAFPWNQLTSFEHNRTLSEYDSVELLRRCPRLVKYGVRRMKGTLCPRIMHPSRPSPTASDRVLHTSLKELHIGHQAVGFLQFMTIPSLTTLTIHGVRASDESIIQEFLARSNCSIQKLNYKNGFRTRMRNWPRFTLLDSSEVMGSLVDVSFETTIPLVMEPSPFRRQLAAKAVARAPPPRPPWTLTQTISLSKFPLQVLGRMTIIVPPNDTDWSSSRSLFSPISSLIKLIRCLPSLQFFSFSEPRYLWKTEDLNDDLKLLKSLLMMYEKDLKERIKSGLMLYLFVGKLWCPSSSSSSSSCSSLHEVLTYAFRYTSRYQLL
jgi:hypothetical protein